MGMDFEKYPNIEWELDLEASERAGYRVFRDTKEFYNTVSDLGARFEVTIKDNQSFNLWLLENKGMEPVEITKCESKDKSVDGITVTFTPPQVILIKGALGRLSTTFNEMNVSSGNYEYLNVSMECLKTIEMLKNEEDKQLPKEQNMM